MTDYGELAQKLSNQRSRAQWDREAGVERESDATQIFERVKIHAGNEIEKANAELRKRKLATLERVFLPSYQGKVCLTFGSQLLCAVELQQARGQITAVISGPPNAAEISRKVFLLSEGYSPDAIAAEIVSGLLMGKFS